MNIPFSIFAVVALALVPVVCASAEPAVASPPAPARAAVDPAMEAAHTQEDVKRHRTMAAAHEAAAKCQESGKAEDLCMAELAKACKGIAYGKYCGMKHPD